MANPIHTLRALAFRAYRDLEIREHKLLYLFFELTRRCNLACRHCGSDCASQILARELSTQTWLDLVAYMKTRFDPFFVITGGEPLVSPALAKVSECFAERNCRWGLVTNGFALTPERFERLVDRGLSSMTISVDGSEESHNWLRRHPESYERAMKAVAILGKSRLLFRDVVSCVWRGNLGDLDELGGRLVDAGLNSWRIFRIFPKGRAAAEPELVLDRDDTERLLDWIAEKRPLYKKAGLNLSYSCEGYVGYERDRTIRDEPYFCRSGINFASILADGSITGCNNNGPDYIQGHIAVDDFAEVWERRFNEYRDRSWMRTGLCAACAYWKDCLGSSIHLKEKGSEGPAFCYLDHNRIRRVK